MDCIEFKKRTYRFFNADLEFILQAEKPLDAGEIRIICRDPLAFLGMAEKRIRKLERGNRGSD